MSYKTLSSLFDSSLPKKLTGRYCLHIILFGGLMNKLILLFIVFLVYVHTV